eukprot:4032205-Pyramimonas_sp.AAC.1
MLTPLDALISSSVDVDRALHVYADDLTMQIIARASHVLEQSYTALKGVVDVLHSIELAPAKRKMTVTATDMPVARK